VYYGTGNTINGVAIPDVAIWEDDDARTVSDKLDIVNGGPNRKFISLS